VAGASGPVFSVVSGGIACFVIVAIIAARVPELWNYTITKLHDDDLEKGHKAVSSAPMASASEAAPGD
jgi:asparagine synthetase B (glutamine-hydrolysing)